jgi:hypothetical protein
VNNISYGDGFQYPKGNASALFDASLMVGTDSNHISDNAYGNTVDMNAIDWKTAYDGKFSFPVEGGADQVIRCAVTDSGNLTSRLGMKVVQRSFAYANPPDNDYIILRYDVYNTHTGTTSSDTLKNVYVGLFADWDVNNYATNEVGYDSSRNLGYMWDSSVPWYYYGISVLTPPAASFRAIDNAVYVAPTGPYNGFTEGNKYRFLTQGFQVTHGATPKDWSFIISAGPYTIPPNSYKTVGFAFLGGDSLSDLQTHADAALLKANTSNLLAVKEVPGATPREFMLRQNYPNPFNPGTQISYSIPNRNHVTLKVYDMLGHEIATLVDEELSAGTYQTHFDGSGLSSGLYYYRLVSGNYVNTKKFMLVK